MLEDNNFNSYEAEKIELDTLLDRGIEFTIETKSIFGKKKTKKFLIQQPYLGTLDHLSEQFIEMNFSEEAIKEDWMQEGKRMIAADAKRCARIAAIAVLNSKWKIKFLTGIYANYFLWRMTPKKLMQLTTIIFQISNIADFINSIRYLAIQTRTTSPALMEKIPEEQQLD
ncbi:hypothetical protein [Dyadobacter sp. LHD-138]|uniref:hypothetical protein n=1 Tax=Dyadobacter sp. LHD-138 TaxID=3071413 RepID=UPI0027DF91CB|nr:hypothetical protein [Dyadobacter sp. LHD-138]MDQ6482220.1 hypothetical protein [Dyadobacter sp. LHD-138]